MAFQRRKARRRKRRLITAGIFCGLLGLLYFAFDRETSVLNESTRKSAQGTFIRVPDGIVHYELTGPSDGPLVVFIHGGSIPYFVWDRNAPALAKSGFRTLRYDLFGRGYSDRPKAVYDQAFYNRQLFSLLKALDIRTKAHIVGVSMGAGIAASFASQYPEYVNKLCFIDPIGFAVDLPAITKLMHVPGLGEFLFRMTGYWILTRSFVRNDFFVPAACPEYFLKAYEDQMKYDGFERALLSTLRNMPLDRMTGVFEKVGRSNREILIIWGKEDRTTPFAASEQALKAMPGARLFAVERAGHLSGFERPEIVNPLLIEFLKRGT